MSEPRLPGIPGDLDSTGKALYRRLREAMREREGRMAWQSWFHEALAATCRHGQRARLIRPHVEHVNDMVSEGDRKQLTVNPLMRILQTEEKAFLDGLDKL